VKRGITERPGLNSVRAEGKVGWSKIWDEIWDDRGGCRCFETGGTFLDCIFATIASVPDTRAGFDGVQTCAQGLG
jgi:hypothetical protein